ncbi:uncharacterized protein LOC132066006 [Lycium ferocissimum]|uniref:uncharacterized protein LOC132066006 n=1 Tax=Lycium ferocissimum TaxID=112874 RepID=UPI002814974B|nr:uncharacterized protein LOC132066006 [Lycium ferocissimum]
MQWNNVAKPEIYYHNDGYFLVKFATKEDHELVLYSGPYMLNNRPVIVKGWTPGFNFNDEVLRTIPLWVRLPNLPLSCWVEVDVTHKLPNCLKVEEPDGSIFEQAVEFDWKPQFCTECLQIGHVCLDDPAPKKVGIRKPGKQAWNKAEGNKEAQHKEKGGRGKEVAQSSAGTGSEWKQAKGGSPVKVQPIKQNVPPNNAFNPLVEEANHKMITRSQIRDAANMWVVTWNVRGLNQAYKQKELQVFVQRNKVGLLAIVEHRVHQKNAARVVKQVFPRWQWQHNYQVGGKGRIWVVWDARLCDFSVIQSTPQYIHGYLRIHANNMAFHLTVIYRLHSIQDRKPLWEDLTNIAGLMSIPWLVMGDFNAIMHVNDRTYGAPKAGLRNKGFM